MSILAIVPAFNPRKEDYKNSIESLLKQTIPLDILIVDDGSSLPLENLGDFGDRVTVLRQAQNGGITKALHAGVEYGITHGYQYLCRLDIGDISYPERVADQASYMETHPEVDLLGAFSKVVNMDGEFLFMHGTKGGPEGVKRQLWRNAAFKHSTFFLRTKSLVTLGNYDTSYPAGQDNELAQRYAKYGVVDCLPTTLIEYVDDPGGLSARKRKIQLKMRLRTQLRYPAFGNISWYLGVARTAGLIVVPNKIAKAASIRLWRNRFGSEKRNA